MHKIYSILLLLAFASGYGLCMYWPTLEDNRLKNITEKIKNEDFKFLAKKNKFKELKKINDKELIVLNKHNQLIADKNKEEKIKKQSEIIKKQKQIIANRDAEIKFLTNTIKTKIKTQQEQLDFMNKYSKDLARAKGQNKILFGATVGLGVTTGVLLALCAGMVYFKK